MPPTSSSSSQVFISGFVNSTLASERLDTAQAGSGRSLANLEKAVYGYIRAIRALGKTRINTSEIANALGITIAEVESTLLALNKKGVKIAP